MKRNLGAVVALAGGHLVITVGAILFSFMSTMAAFDRGGTLPSRARLARYLVRVLMFPVQPTLDALIHPLPRAFHGPGEYVLLAGNSLVWAAAIMSGIHLYSE